jgi:hypothetical protein
VGRTGFRRPNLAAPEWIISDQRVEFDDISPQACRLFQCHRHSRAPQPPITSIIGASQGTRCAPGDRCGNLSPYVREVAPRCDRDLRDKPATEFNHAIRALLDRYPKGRILAALQATPLRPGPKQKDDPQILINMGRVMTWHRDLSDRAAAEIVTRHLQNNRSSIIDRFVRVLPKIASIIFELEK